MDNFRRHSPRRNKPTSIDGFVRNPKNDTSDALGEGNFRRSRSYSNITPKKLDDFNVKSDGFTARVSNGSVGPDGTATGRRRPTKKDVVDLELDNDKPDKKKKRLSFKIVARSFACLLIISVLLSGYVFGKGYLRARQVFNGGGSAASLSDDIDPSKLKGEGDGRINVLLLAVGGEGHDGSELTDTILVASIDPINKDAGLLSIPRDLWVKSNGSSMKINAVYALTKESALAKGKTQKQAEDAGFSALESKVADVSGLKINYHALVDFTGFKEAIDTVGGVTINVPTPLVDSSMAHLNGGNPVLAPAGVQTMNGTKALYYAQSRHGSARGDFDRTERQRQVLIALKDKVFTAGTYGNPVKITQLMDNFGNHIKTNFSIDDIMKMYNLGKGIDSSKVTSIGLADPPQELVTTGFISSQSVVVPKAGTFEYAAIRSFVRNTFKDGFLKKENPSVLVLNGTARSGVASSTADVLKSYGYNVVRADDAPSKDYQQNVLVDLTGGKKKYTKRYLELRFKTSAVSKLPEGVTNPENADFVIIVGQNGTTQN